MEVGLYIRKQHFQLMLEDAICREPIEACGMMAGRGGTSEKIYIITNISNSPTRFRMAPEEQLKALNEIDDLDLELLAIYHSHPNGPVEPSAVDIKEFAYPGTKYIIWSRKDHDWVCHGYNIANQKVTEVPIIILENE